MREIKFRAWRPKNKTMIYFEDNLMYIKQILITLIFEKSKYLMQFIGLKDKNGIEIYEGDVLKGITKYNREKFNKNRVYFIKGTIMCGNVSLYNCTDIEVIGNIYENKELLDDRN